MGFVEALIEKMHSIIMQIWAVVIERPVVTAIVMTIVFGAAVIASVMDEANRKVDALIEDALDEDKEANQ